MCEHTIDDLWVVELVWYMHYGVAVAGVCNFMTVIRNIKIYRIRTTPCRIVYEHQLWWWRPISSIEYGRILRTHPKFSSLKIAPPSDEAGLFTNRTFVPYSTRIVLVWSMLTAAPLVAELFANKVSSFKPSLPFTSTKIVSKFELLIVMSPLYYKQHIQSYH